MSHNGSHSYDLGLLRRFKYLEEIRETPGYLKAKDRIELIKDIFSINEENYQIILDQLSKYLRENSSMVQHFICVAFLFISTRFKAAKKFGPIFLNFFAKNYMNDLQNLINIQISLKYPVEYIKNIFIYEITKNDFNNLSFYNYEEGTIPYYLFNDDISGLQDYVSRRFNVDFNEKPIIKYLKHSIILDYFEPNLFQHSILFGSIKCFKYIMLNDAVNIDNECNMAAIASGNSEIIHILEQKNVFYDARCFELAILFHHNEIFQWLVRMHLPYFDFHCRIESSSILFLNEEIFHFIVNNYGSPFMIEDFILTVQYAIYSFNFPLFKYLYENIHMDKNFIYNLGTPNLLCFACFLNQLDLVKYLIINDMIDIESTDIYNNRAIHVACQYGYLPIVEFLVSQGCDINAKNSRMETPFFIACKFEQLSVMEFLYTTSKIDINAKNGDGITPFFDACTKCSLPIVKFLVEHGCDQTCKTQQGDLPFFNYFKEEIARYIVLKNKDNLLSDSKGRTFLHYSAYYNRTEFCKDLISLNIDKDSKDQNGMTPLHHACLSNSLDSVKYLISINADKESIDNYKRTPLHYACLNNCQKVYEYLISIGANQEQKDVDGFTPFALANLRSSNIIKYRQIVTEVEIVFTESSFLQKHQIINYY